MVRVGGYKTKDTAYGVAIAGNYAYVADHLSGLLGVNVSNPTNPVLVGNCDTIGYANNVAVSGAYAYVIDQWTGF